MKVSDEPVLSPNNTLENVSLTDQFMAWHDVMFYFLGKHTYIPKNLYVLVLVMYVIMCVCVCVCV